MTLMKAQDALTGRKRRPVEPPADMTFPHEQMRWRGWVVFQGDLDDDGMFVEWQAVHEDTGEVRKIDMTGMALMHPPSQDFRDYIDLGFPTRWDVPGCSGPIRRQELDFLLNKEDGK